MDICKFENGSESYYYYLSMHSEKQGYLETAEYAINKIVVNADGTLSTEKRIIFDADENTGEMEG